MTAWRQGEDDDLPTKELTAIQDAAIHEVVKMQEDIGLQVVTDGEFRRAGWTRGFQDATGAFTFTPSKLTFRNEEGVTAPAPAPVAQRKVSWRKPIVADDFTFIKNATSVTAKVTMPTPSVFHFGHFSEAMAPEAYDNIDDYWADLLEVYRTELKLLGERGCDLLQLDEVPLVLCCDDTNRQVAIDNGEDPDRLVEKYFEMLDAILAARPAGMRVLLHMCRGNMQGLWMGDGGYGQIAERLFGDTDVDGFLLEYDSPRAGDFAPLQHLAKGKIVYLGLISTKKPDVENADDLKRRIDEAATNADLGQLGISPQCGFGSAAMSKFNVQENPMTADVQRGKLERLVEVAGDVWG